MSEAKSPPTDKALAVMRVTHIEALDRARALCSAADEDVFFDLGDIESLVHYLVEHPDRLAGEDEVVVKRDEIEALNAMTPAAGFSDSQIVVRTHFATECWLAGSPTAQEDL